MTVEIRAKETLADVTMVRKVVLRCLSHHLDDEINEANTVLVESERMCNYEKVCPLVACCDEFVTAIGDSVFVAKDCNPTEIEAMACYGGC
jgi:hypothetical protein